MGWNFTALKQKTQWINPPLLFNSLFPPTLHSKCPPPPITPNTAHQTPLHQTPAQRMADAQYCHISAHMEFGTIFTRRKFSNLRTFLLIKKSYIRLNIFRLSSGLFWLMFWLPFWLLLKRRMLINVLTPGFTLIMTHFWSRFHWSIPWSDSVYKPLCPCVVCVLFVPSV